MKADQVFIVKQIGSRKDSNSGTQPFQQDRVYDPTGISPALQQGLPEGGHKIVQRTPLKFLNRNQKNIEGDYAFTVDSMNTGGVRDGMKIRRLTPLECERLMGFPDNWTEFGVRWDGSKSFIEKISDTQRYKMCGNAVVTNVVKAIMEKLI